MGFRPGPSSPGPRPRERQPRGARSCIFSSKRSPSTPSLDALPGHGAPEHTLPSPREETEAQRGRGEGQRAKGPPLSSTAASCPRGSEGTPAPGRQARAPRGAVWRGEQAARSKREGQWRRGPDQGGRGPLGHQRPPGVEGDASRGRTEAAARGPGQRGGHDASEGGAGTWGPFFRQEEEDPSHQSGSGQCGGQTRAREGGPCPSACGRCSTLRPTGGTQRPCRGRLLGPRAAGEP